MDLPKVGEVYLHQNGGYYQVTGFALDQDSEQLNVIHKGLKDGRVWSRDIGNFMALKNGLPRFKLTDDSTPIR